MRQQDLKNLPFSQGKFVGNFDGFRLDFWPSLTG